MAVVVVVAVIAAGAGAAITLVAKGSGKSHPVGTPLTNAAPPGTTATPSSAIDSSAKTVARTAQTAMETYSTENNGEYTGGTAAKLNSIEPSLNITNANEAELEETSIPTPNEYKVTAVAANTGDKFSVIRKANGEAEHECVSSTNGCPGHVNKTSSW